MNRKDFQALARVRLTEARVLLKAGCYDGAYYLAGYVVEFALKSVIARKTKRYDFPDLADVRESYTHDLKRLVRVAELQGELDEELRTDPAFKNHWDAVAIWSEESRYARATEPEAAELLRAITDPKSGVLRWIRRFW